MANNMSANHSAESSRPSSPPSPHDMTTEELKFRTQDLPQELYDQIKSLAFTVDTTHWTCDHTPTHHLDFVRIDQNYLPPAQLQISMASRADFSARFYSNEQAFIFTNVYVMEKWLKSLPNSADRNIAKSKLCCPVTPIRPRDIIRKMWDLREWFERLAGATDMWPSKRNAYFCFGDEERCCCGPQRPTWDIAAAMWRLS